MTPRWHKWGPPVVGAFFGFATFAVSLGLTLVNPTRIDWVLQGDPGIHFLGWHMFRRGPWTMPLGAVPLWTAPVGTSVGLTDSIPALVIFLKPFSPLLPLDFQYLGAWLLCCFVLQGVFAALLMRRLTADSTQQMLGAALIVMSPPMIVRQGHAALTAHWLVLAALWMYFRERPGKPVAGWAVLCGFAAATHPYLALMVFTISVAAFAREALSYSAAWFRGFAGICVVALSMAVALWQSGYFVVSAASGLQVGGFGHYSMNGLAVIQPLGYTRAPHGPIEVATSGQYEGYAYLGAGVLMMALVAIVVRLRNGGVAAAELVRHLPLLAALSFLTLLALSPVVTVGPWKVLAYDPGWWGPFAIFRASGRLFWPAYYVLVLWILASVGRLGSRRARMLMAAAVVVQAVDVSATYRVLQDVRTYTFKSRLHSHFWEVVPQHYRRLVLFPTNMCVPREFVDHTDLSVLAGHHGMRINAGGAARTAFAEMHDYCRDLELEINAGIVDQSALYILRRDLVANFRNVAQVPVVCTTVDEFGVCAARETYVDWQTDFDVMYSVLPPLAELLAFNDALDAEYANRLRRPLRTMAAPSDVRITTLMRYFWYRLGGCSQAETVDKLLRERPHDLRICGDPFRGKSLPTIEETHQIRLLLEKHYQQQQASEPSSSHVDAEGEAVWFHRYVRERLDGRDAYGARVEVLNAIRAATPAPTQ
ncbi:MAG: DUF6311 domain-containing protein [Vicinamibacterales bacterium]